MTDDDLVCNVKCVSVAVVVVGCTETETETETTLIDYNTGSIVSILGVK